MAHAQDVSLPLPEPGPAAAAAAGRLAKRGTGIVIGAPQSGDPPGTACRFAWPIPRAPWVACGLLGRRGDLLEVRSLQLAALTAGAAVTSDVLRRVSTAAILAAAHAHLALTAAATSELATVTGTRPDAGTMALGTVRPAGPGRPRLPDSLLRDAAEAFLEEAPRGRGIHERIALRLERKHRRSFSATQVRHAITRAQQAGWLSAGRPGAAQRAPGPRLAAAWKQDGR